MLKSFDFFPKSSTDEGRVRTPIGGLLSILCFVLLIYGVWYEIHAYQALNDQTKMTLLQDQLQTELPFALDMVVENNCSDMHFDVTSRTMSNFLKAKVEFEKTQRGKECLINASGVLPRVQGSFHVGLGTNVIKNNVHRHMTMLLDSCGLNHRIDRLSFGEVPTNSTIDGIRVNINNDVCHQVTYFVQLVPILLHGQHTYQAITSMTKTKLEKMRTNGISGVVFQWSFSPIGFKTEKERVPVLHLLSHLLALAGIVFFFIRTADFLLFSLTSKIHRK